MIIIYIRNNNYVTKEYELKTKGMPKGLTFTLKKQLGWYHDSIKPSNLGDGINLPIRSPPSLIVFLHNLQDDLDVFAY